MSNTKQFVPQLNKLSDQIGKFVEFWGFKKIHGVIWTHLYLSSKPLTAQELISRLKVSKALVSLSLKDMLEFNLVVQTKEPGNKKNKYYSANPRVFDFIKHVLQTRELQMLNTISGEYAALVDVNQKEPHSDLESERVEQLGRMIEAAHVALGGLINLNTDAPDLL